MRSTKRGSWVAIISRVISRVAIAITYIRGLITPLVTTQEPPSRPRIWGLGVEFDSLGLILNPKKAQEGP